MIFIFLVMRAATVLLGGCIIFMFLLVVRPFLKFRGRGAWGTDAEVNPFWQIDVF